MNKLERLTQDEFGYRQDGWRVFDGNIRPAGKIITITVPNPCLDISSVIDEFAARDSVLIPKNANAYVASDFNGDTQHLRDGKPFSVYAIQFYQVLW